MKRYVKELVPDRIVLINLKATLDRDHPFLKELDELILVHQIGEDYREVFESKDNEYMKSRIKPIGYSFDFSQEWGVWYIWSDGTKQFAPPRSWWSKLMGKFFDFRVNLSKKISPHG